MKREVPRLSRNRDDEGYQNQKNEEKHVVVIVILKGEVSNVVW